MQTWKFLAGAAYTGVRLFRRHYKKIDEKGQYGKLELGIGH